MVRREFKPVEAVKCPTCKGTGCVALYNRRGQRYYEKCPTCNGRGYLSGGK